VSGLKLLASPFVLLCACLYNCSAGDPCTTTVEYSTPSETQININFASIEDIERLPGVGPVLATRIVEHRKKYGPFKRPEHIIVVDGISEARFHKLKPFIKTR
jgi:competence ComEA-like helix-hairpin-helix protein